MNVNLRWLLMIFFLHPSIPPRRSRQRKIPRIGYVDAGSPATTGHRAKAFVQGLRDLGIWKAAVLRFEYRWAEAKLQTLTALLAELARFKIDVIVTSATPAIRCRSAPVCKFISSVVGRGQSGGASFLTVDQREV